MYGLNDLLEDDKAGATLHAIAIRRTDDLKRIFAELPFTSCEDVIGKMLDSFIDEYSLYADMERTLRAHADELGGDDHERPLQRS